MTFWIGNFFFFVILNSSKFCFAIFFFKVFPGTLTSESTITLQIISQFFFKYIFASWSLSRGIFALWLLTTARLPASESMYKAAFCARRAYIINFSFSILAINKNKMFKIQINKSYYVRLRCGGAMLLVGWDGGTVLTRLGGA